MPPSLEQRPEVLLREVGDQGTEPAPSEREVYLVRTALWEALGCFPQESLQEYNRIFATVRVETFFVGPRFKDAFSKAGVLAIIRSARAILDEAGALFVSRHLLELLTQIERIEVVE